MFINEFRGAGRLTADVQIRSTSSGVNFAYFTLAIERPKVEGKETETDFIDVKVWRGKAEWLVNNIGKGTALYVEGRIKIDRWTDQQGQKQTRFYVEADDVKVVSYADVKRPANYVEPAQRGQQPQGYAPYGYPAQPAQGQYQQPQGYVPYGYPAQPAQGQYQQPQSYAPAQGQGYVPPAPAPQAQMPGPGYNPGADFTPIIDDDLPF